MASLSGPNDIVDLMGNIVRALMTFFNKLYNVLENFFTFGQCSGNQKPNLQNQTLGSVEVL